MNTVKINLLAMAGLTVLFLNLNTAYAHDESQAVAEGDNSHDYHVIPLGSASPVVEDASSVNGMDVVHHHPHHN